MGVCGLEIQFRLTGEVGGVVHIGLCYPTKVVESIGREESARAAGRGAVGGARVGIIVTPARLAAGHRALHLPSIQSQNPEDGILLSV